MKNMDYMAVAEKAIAQIRKGAFLTVKTEEALNTMTIGWAMVGFMWSKPVFTVAVRDSRHTFGIIEKAKDFTVTVPLENMKEAIMFCGTKSGRDVDKFEECDLKLTDARKVFTPIVQTPGLHFECKIIYKTAMNPHFLDEGYKKLYPEADYHTLYYGEILDCYEL